MKLTRRKPGPKKSSMLRTMLMPALAAAGLLLLSAPPASATAILVGAPTATTTVWDTQVHVPPSGIITDFADQFSLSGSQFVSEITVLIFGVSTNPSQFRFSLVDSLTASTPLYTAAASTPTSITTFHLPIEALLAAGTYYLRLQTDGFVGWVASDAQFITTAGTVSKGIWSDRNDTGWRYYEEANSFNNAAVFSVLGAVTTTSVPEPATVALLGIGLCLGLARARRPIG